MIKIRVSDDQIEIYSDDRIIEFIGGPLSKLQIDQLVSDWFYKKPMQVEVLSNCIWYYQNIELQNAEFEYAKGGIINP